MTTITEDMVTRAFDVLLNASGLNREVVRRALDAALNVPLEGEDEIRRITQAAMANPGKTASIGPDGNVVLRPDGES